MQIKNKAGLVERAKQHQANDEIVFRYDWYSAPVVTNGGIEYFIGPFDEWSRKGAKLSVCAVGCLALPVDLDEKGRFDFGDSGTGGVFARSIEEEFGVPEWLQDQAEDAFLKVEKELFALEPNDPERQRQLSQFVVDFVEAIPEGVQLSGPVSRRPESWQGVYRTPAEFLAYLRDFGKVSA